MLCELVSDVQASKGRKTVKAQLKVVASPPATGRGKKGKGAGRLV